MARDQSNFSNLTKWTFRNIPGVMRSYRNWIAVIKESRAIAWQLKWGARIRHYGGEMSMSHMTSQAPEKYHSFLTPRYPIGCKRVILDSGYLACLNQSNVDMITDPIATVNAGGIVGKSGTQYDFDVLILATGFVVGSGEQGADITGRNGTTLSQQWKFQGGAQAYLGTSIHNFPNFFSLLGPNVASGHASLIYSIEAQVKLLVKFVEPMVKLGVTSFEVKLDSEKIYNDAIQQRLNGTVRAAGCQSYYINESGKNTFGFPGPLTEFVRKCQNVSFEDYVQIGGTKRLAFENLISNLLKNVLKGLAILSMIIYIRNIGGLENLKGELILFALSRMQEAKHLIAKLPWIMKQDSYL